MEDFLKSDLFDYQFRKINKKQFLYFYSKKVSAGKRVNTKLFDCAEKLRYNFDGKGIGV